MQTLEPIRREDIALEPFATLFLIAASDGPSFPALAPLELQPSCATRLLSKRQGW